MKINTNLGLYAEEIINNTCAFYKEKNICFIEKREIPIKILRNYHETNYIVGRLLNKAKIDYFGFYNGKHIEFEVKQTSESFFNKSLLKKHQIEHLELLLDKGIFCFLIIYSEVNEKFYFIKYSDFKKFEKNKILFSELEKKSNVGEVVFPGIFDFIKFVE